jgi:hypothetical protein
MLTIYKSTRFDFLSYKIIFFTIILIACQKRNTNSLQIITPQPIILADSAQYGTPLYLIQEI